MSRANPRHPATCACGACAYSEAMARTIASPLATPAPSVPAAPESAKDALVAAVLHRWALEIGDDADANDAADDAVRQAIHEYCRASGASVPAAPAETESVMWRAVVAGYLRGVEESEPDRGSRTYERRRAMAEAFAAEYTDARPAAPAAGSAETDPVRLAAENERLRAALREALTMAKVGEAHYRAEGGPVSACHDIARVLRAALAPSAGGAAEVANG